MKTSNTSDRLSQVMKERNLRQIDIIRLAEPYCKFYKQKLGRNDLSQFVSGKVNPGQWKLTILGLALNVSESWLMGYDVPMERSPNSNTIYQALTPHEDKVITAYRNKPAAQPKVDELLDVEPEEETTPSEDGVALSVAARGVSVTEKEFDEYISGEDAMKKPKKTE